jgi:hypothetical protein
MTHITHITLFHIDRLHMATEARMPHFLCSVHPLSAASDIHRARQKDKCTAQVLRNRLSYSAMQSISDHPM